MPRYRKPASPSWERLVALRRARGLSQVELACWIGSIQRAIPHYEVEACLPPADVVIQLAQARLFSSDELLGRPQPEEGNGEEEAHRRLCRKFRKILDLPEKYQRAITRMIHSLAQFERNGRR